jgi:hypothetical protein
MLGGPRIVHRDAQSYVAIKAFVSERGARSARNLRDGRARHGQVANRIGLPPGRVTAAPVGSPQPTVLA